MTQNGIERLVEDDPARPYKAIMAAAGAAILALLGAGLEFEPWLKILLTVVAAGLGAYATPNPKRRKRAKKKQPYLGNRRNVA